MLKLLKLGQKNSERSQNILLAGSSFAGHKKKQALVLTLEVFFSLKKDHHREEIFMHNI